MTLSRKSIFNLSLIIVCVFGFSLSVHGQDDPNCANISLPSRLPAGAQGRVLPDQLISLTDDVANPMVQLGELPPGTRFTVPDDMPAPTCIYDTLYVYVVSETGLAGWAMEIATNYYLLEPLTTPASPEPTSPPATTTPITDLRDAVQVARTPVPHNADWIPFEYEFEGVTMVLVPAGCFQMGNDDGDEDQKPAHEQCFAEPFWIDRYEVTNEQFERLGGNAAMDAPWPDPSDPRGHIDWLEARDFCLMRGGHLPTEREWEYAARGLDGLLYPWGNIWYTQYAVSNDNYNPDFEAAAVGSRPGGQSWVGADDMAGNMWEWVSSEMRAYPYDASDGRETYQDVIPELTRVIRGGSWSYSSGFHKSTYRLQAFPRSGGADMGFRCVRSLDDSGG